MNGSWDPRRTTTAFFVWVAVLLVALSVTATAGHRHRWFQIAFGLLWLALIGTLAAWASRAVRQRER